MQFYTSKGWLTSYALTCGYIEKHTHNGLQVTLWKEHGVYHVRAHDFNTHMRLFWDVTYSITEARKIYSKAKRSFK